MPGQWQFYCSSLWAFCLPKTPKWRPQSHHPLSSEQTPPCPIHKKDITHFCYEKWFHIGFCNIWNMLLQIQFTEASGVGEGVQQNNIEKHLYIYTFLTPSFSKWGLRKQQHTTNQIQEQLALLLSQEHDRCSSILEQITRQVCVKRFYPS